MTVGLPISNVVDVSASLTSIGTSYLNLQTLLIVGDSNVIDTFERIREYNTLLQVADDFLTSSPEYLAAEVYFDQTPTPTVLFIGRWANAGSAGVLVGGILNNSQQLMSNWTTITTGAFNTTISGAPFTITGLNFATQTNLNGVASAIQTAIQAATVAPPLAPVLSSSAAGTIAQTTYFAKITYVTSTSGETLAGPEATLLVTANHVLNVASPLAAGTFITGYNVYLSTATGTETKQNTTPIAIGTPWVMPTSGIISSTALPSTNTAFIAPSATATVVWSAEEDCFTFTSGGTGATSSFGFLTAPGTGTNIATQLQGTATLAQYSAPGIAAESALAAVIALANLNTYWYGLEFATGNNNTDIADSDYLAIAGFIQASTASTGNPHIFGVTTSESGALSSVTTTDIGAELQALGYNRTFAMYSSENVYGCGALYGLLVTVNFSAQDSMIDLMWKEVAGVVPENLTSTQAAALNSKNYNYFATLNNGVSIIFNGSMASQAFIDEIYGLDGLVNRIQTDIVNYMVATNKVPQTDAGVGELITVIQGSCSAFVNNGYLAPGVWDAGAIGPINTGATLSNGFYVWAAPIALQSAANRQARVSPVIQVLGKEAGAINTIVVNLTVNR